MLEQWLVVVAVLLVLSVFGSKASGRLGVPALLFFLALGVLAGSEGVLGIAWRDLAAIQAVGVIALIYILFSGGLDTSWAHIRPVLRSGVLLSTVGVLLTAAFMALFAVLALGFTPVEGLLLGAVISSTDAAAVFTILRSKEVRLRGNLEPLLELESGSNDPVAVFLTLSALRLTTLPEAGVLDLIPFFIAQFLVGGTLGVLGGYGAVQLINRARLRFDGLYSVLTVAVPLLVFGLTSLLGGNGFLAVYLTGLMMNRQDFIHKNSLKRFHDSLAWLMQILMFLTLGLLISPSRLLAAAGIGLVTALVLCFWARPLSVFITLARSQFNLREKMLIGWVGLRGAVPIILALFPLIQGVQAAERIFDIVFFIVLISVLLQGSTVPLVGRWLGLQASPSPEQANRARAEALRRQLAEATIPRGGAVAGQQIVDLRLPPAALLVQIIRDGEAFVPNGSTVLEEGDTVLFVAEPEHCARVKQKLEARRANPFFAE